MKSGRGSGGVKDAAVGGLVSFVMLWFLWPLQDVLTALTVPAALLPTRLWVAAVVAPSLLIGASVYLRAPSLLWQIPVQALAFACLIVGLRILILGWRHVSLPLAAIGLGYLVAGAALGWLMRDLQRHVFSPHKPRKPPDYQMERL
jgi:hypothetical protein